MLQLRPFQKQALEALASPQHVLCIAPTGSGKSLIYERMVSRGNSRMLLVTPLIALARQQYSRLQAQGVAVELGSGGLPNGLPTAKTDAWIVSPESLIQTSRREALSKWKPDFLVVDECHCLWEWGENFRPAFQKLPALLREHQIQRSLWLTATLPPDAKDEMRAQMPQSLVEVGSFDLPPRLTLRLARTAWMERAEVLLQEVRKAQGPGIVFVLTRESTSKLARLLVALGKKVAVYHAGMAHEERRKTEEIIAAKAVDVIIATSAFGMGMDYSFLRWVILWQTPTSLLSLTQAIGRVGRADAAAAEALVLWEDEDFQLLEWAAHSSERKRRDLRDVADFLRGDSCRRLALRRYFNSSTEVDANQWSCGACDYCLEFGDTNLSAV
jgi:ATP-dependent DNA helicase RecQ